MRLAQTKPCSDSPEALRPVKPTCSSQEVMPAPHAPARTHGTNPARKSLCAPEDLAEADPENVEPALLLCARAAVITSPPQLATRAPTLTSAKARERVPLQQPGVHGASLAEGASPGNKQATHSLAAAATRLRFATIQLFPSAPHTHLLPLRLLPLSSARSVWSKGRRQCSKARASFLARQGEGEKGGFYPRRQPAASAITG